MSAHLIKASISEKATSYLLPMPGFALIVFLNLDHNSSCLTSACLKSRILLVVICTINFKSLQYVSMLLSSIDALLTTSRIMS